MAVVSRIAIITLTSATGTRTFRLEMAAQDTPAGDLVNGTFTQTTTGAAPPGPPTALTVGFFDDNGTFVKAITMHVTATPQAAGFVFTTNGNSGQPARAGTVEVYIEATRSGTGSTSDYYVTTNGINNTLPTGTTVTARDRGWIRGTTTAAITVSNVIPGGGMGGPFAYGQHVYHRVTLGAPLYTSARITHRFGSVLSGLSDAVATQVFDRAFVTAITNAFPASPSTQTADLTINGSSITGLAQTVLTYSTASATVDPRLKPIHLMQLDDNAFATPPMAGDDGDARMIHQIGFLDTRWVNANGDGIDGLTYSVSLQDAAALVDPVTRTGVLTTTKGGEAGWGATLLPWVSQLPGGAWPKTVTLTTPDAVGLETADRTKTYLLIAANPSLRLVTAAGPGAASQDGKHFTAGMTLLVGVAVVNVTSGRTVALDTGAKAPAAMIGRFNLTFARAEYLAADGLTWLPTQGAVAHFHPLTQSPGDPNVWIASFSGTAAWGTSDVFVIGSAYVGGVPVNDFYKEIVVSGVNNHDTLDTLATGLSDVSVTGATAGQVLTFNGTTWTAQPAPGGAVEPSDIAAIANAVWDEATAEARAAGSYGVTVRDLAARATETRLGSLDAAVSSRASAASVAALGSPAQTSDARFANLDAAVSSRATGASVAALGAPAQASDVRLDRLDAAVSSRAAASAVTALGSPVQTGDARLANLDATVSSRASSADTATLLSRLTSSRAGLLDNLANLNASVAALGAPVQAADPRLANLDAAVSTRATPADVPVVGDPVQTDDPRLDRLDVAVSTRAPQRIDASIS